MTVQGALYRYEAPDAEGLADLLRDIDAGIDPQLIDKR
jgi:hypothetical protein